MGMHDLQGKIIAEKDARIAELAAEVAKYKAALEAIVDELMIMTSTYDSALNARDIARNALKERK